MRNWTKAAMLGAGLIGALTAAGCAGDYYGDGEYGHSSYYGDHSYGNRGYDDSYRYRADRVRVCDADGDDCHWEYRH
jgi:hypothetical protein